MDKEMEWLLNILNGKKDTLDDEKKWLEEELKMKDDELNAQLREAGNNFDKLKELEMKLWL